MSWLTIGPSEEEMIDGCYTIHVIPSFGREHQLWEFCWCEPRQDPEDPDILIHEQDH